MLKIVFKVTMVLFLASCASQKKETLRIQDRISSEQVRSLKEIQNHSEMILEAHPELSLDEKLTVKNFMNEALEKQQLLKDEESKVVQLLLSKSLRENQLNHTELRDKEALKKRLKSIYESKADNIFSLIQRVTEMFKSKEVNESFESDIQLFMRDIR